MPPVPFSSTGDGRHGRGLCPQKDVKNVTPPKRVAAIHDLSGFGKCSLTEILPILAASGIECSALPTAVLSTHTGGFTGFTYRDLTQDMPAMARHWKEIGVPFDAIYTGFLGSEDQIGIVSDIIDLLLGENSLILIDPVMGDEGNLYQTYTPSMARGVARLCGKADIIVPNLTEAAFLLDEPYRKGPYDHEYIQGIARRLCALGPKKVVITGVYYREDELGAATLDAETHEFSFYSQKTVPGFYHGTGDIFSSVLLCGLLNDLSLPAAAALAVDFTHDCIQRTYDAGVDQRFGVLFEQAIPRLIQRFGLFPAADSQNL